MYTSPTPFLQVSSVLTDYDFCLKWAHEIDLNPGKAETVLKNFHLPPKTKDCMHLISFHIIKSFLLWLLQFNPVKSNLQEAKKELRTVSKLMKLWEIELKLANAQGYSHDYLDGVDYVVTGMKILLNPSEVGRNDEIVNVKPLEGKTRAGLLHVKQEFLRPFHDEMDRRAEVLTEILEINPKDNQACFQLARILGIKRKMDDYNSVPSSTEMDLLVQGNKVSKSRDIKVLTELCYCLAQYLKNDDKEKVSYPLNFYENSMYFWHKNDVAEYINKRTMIIWKMDHDVPPSIYVKFATIQSALLPYRYQHPQISALALVNRSLQKFPTYSKALHRKAKILFYSRQFDAGMKCLEEAFAFEETNCDALYDLVYRLMSYQNEGKLAKLFSKYCSIYGEDLWGKRKVGTMFYLWGCYLWMIDMQRTAVYNWLQAEKRNPISTFYFENMEIHKSSFKWHGASILTYKRILNFLRFVEVTTLEDQFALNSLISRLISLVEKETNYSL